MSAKLEKLLKEVEAEKARIKSQKAAAEKAQVAAVSRLVVKAGLASVPHDFLLPRLERIAAEFAAQNERKES